MNIFIIQPLSSEDDTKMYKTASEFIKEESGDAVINHIPVDYLDYDGDASKNSYICLHCLTALSGADAVILSRDWRKDWLCCMEREFAEHWGKRIITYWDLEKFKIRKEKEAQCECQ